MSYIGFLKVVSIVLWAASTIGLCLWDYMPEKQELFKETFEWFVTAILFVHLEELSK